MKIAVLTAIFGGIDTPKPFPEQSIPCDYFCFTEANTPVPLPNLPDRLKAKYFKLQAHRVLPGYDYYVWIDGNIEVTSPDFVKTMVEAAKGGIAIQVHHERLTIEEEINFILSSDNEYLVKRYGNQPLKQEYEYYLSQYMPPVAPLYSCNIFAWRSDVFSDSADWFFFDEWWKLVTEWSWFDQSAFSFLAWDFSSTDKGETFILNPVNLGSMFDNPFFKHYNHEKIC